MNEHWVVILASDHELTAEYFSSFDKADEEFKNNKASICLAKVIKHYNDLTHEIKYGLIK